jgi:hypothetical protein
MRRHVSDALRAGGDCGAARAHADMLQVTTWLAPQSAQGAAMNIPAFLNVQAILLQRAKPAEFQARPRWPSADGAGPASCIPPLSM